jgi:hypothetical protein
MFNFTDKIIYINPTIHVVVGYYIKEEDHYNITEYSIVIDKTIIDKYKNILLNDNEIGNIQDKFIKENSLYILHLNSGDIIIKYDKKIYLKINNICDKYHKYFEKISKYFENDIFILEDLIKNFKIKEYIQLLKKRKYEYRINIIKTLFIAFLNLLVFDIFSYFRFYWKYKNLKNQEKTLISDKNNRTYETIWNGGKYFSGSTKSFKEHIEGKIQNINIEINTVEKQLSESSRYFIPLIITIAGLIISIIFNQITLSQKETQIKELANTINEKNIKIDELNNKVLKLEQESLILQKFFDYEKIKSK